ncbi:hypothetical protein MP638_002643 [Amoeboaphelidium occidentale]|nr:hypothetical protein MP638_002643 [Amoeboaphelidium occidentale]
MVNVGPLLTPSEIVDAVEEAVHHKYAKTVLMPNLATKGENYLYGIFQESDIKWIKLMDMPNSEAFLREAKDGICLDNPQCLRKYTEQEWFRIVRKIILSEHNVDYFHELLFEYMTDTEPNRADRLIFMQGYYKTMTEEFFSRARVNYVVSKKLSKFIEAQYEAFERLPEEEAVQDFKRRVFADQKMDYELWRVCELSGTKSISLRCFEDAVALIRQNVGSVPESKRAARRQLLSIFMRLYAEPELELVKHSILTSYRYNLDKSA